MTIDIVIWAIVLAAFAMVLWVIWPVTPINDDTDWDI